MSDFYLLQLGIIMMMIFIIQTLEVFPSVCGQRAFSRKDEQDKKAVCGMMSGYNTFYTLYCELHTRPCIYTIALLGGRHESHDHDQCERLNYKQQIPHIKFVHSKPAWCQEYGTHVYLCITTTSNCTSLQI